MAQNTFYNGTVDSNAANRADRSSHLHAIVPFAAAAAGDITVSYDSAKVTTLNTLQSVFDAVVAAARSRGLK